MVGLKQQLLVLALVQPFPDSVVQQQFLGIGVACMATTFRAAAAEVHCLEDSCWKASGKLFSCPWQLMADNAVQATAAFTSSKQHC